MQRTTSLISLKLTEKQIAKFLSKIQVGHPDECWPYKGKPGKSGYGRYSIYSDQQHPIIKLLPNRLAFFLHWKIDPEGWCVCHECDNPICCNWHHLFIGTQNDNSKDRVRKGRQAHGNSVRKVGGTKLRADQVREIRRRACEGHVLLAKEFGLQATYMKKVITGELWRHVE